MKMFNDGPIENHGGGYPKQSSTHNEMPKDTVEYQLTRKQLEAIKTTAYNKGVEVGSSKADKLFRWIEHDRNCILEQWSQGRPTVDGDYESCYNGTWYRRGKEPKCDCGLAEALTPLPEVSL